MPLATFILPKSLPPFVVLGLVEEADFENRRLDCFQFDLQLQRHFAAFPPADHRLHFRVCPLLPHRHCLYFLLKLPPYLRLHSDGCRILSL